MAELDPIMIDGLDATGLDLRFPHEALYEGVLGAADLKPTINGSTVDIAAGRGIVQGDHGTFQGKYGVINDAVKNSAAFEGGGIPAAAANPTVHQIVAKVSDVAYETGLAAGTRKWRLAVVAGTPTAGAQITDPLAANYRAGANALTADPWRSAMPICDVLRATNGTITIADRRPDARGRYPFAATGALTPSAGTATTTYMALATISKDEFGIVNEGGSGTGRIIIPQDGWWAFDTLFSASSLSTGSRVISLEVRTAANVANRDLVLLGVPVDTNETSVQAPSHRAKVTDYFTKGEMVLPKFLLGAGGTTPSYAMSRLAGYRYAD